MAGPQGAAELGDPTPDSRGQQRPLSTRCVEQVASRLGVAWGRGAPRAARGASAGEQTGGLRCAAGLGPRAAAALAPGTRLAG